MKEITFYNYCYNIKLRQFSGMCLHSSKDPMWCILKVKHNGKIIIVRESSIKLKEED